VKIEKNNNIPDTIDKSIENISIILKKKIINFHDSQEILFAIRSYFNIYKRDQKFKFIEKELSKRFSEFLLFFSRQDGLEIASLCYLFSYTLTNDYKSIQDEIYTNIAIPYKKWVTQNWKFNELSEIKRGKKYIYICRHAVTTGGYAPGASVYTFCKALLTQNKEVVLIAFGKVDKIFSRLEKDFTNLSIFIIEKKLTFDTKFKLTIDILSHHEPKMILTEMEFELPSILSILGIPVPIIFLSPGYYNLPWYDKIGLTDNLSNKPVGPRGNDFFEIPTYVSSEILDPFIDPQDIIKAKLQLGIEENDFVLGAFARMEKFKEPFLNFVKKILNLNDNIKLIIAGPNNSDLISNELQYFIKIKRVILLGRSNVHLLAHCIDLGLDTFPTHCGFSLLEIMAKGIPVVSKKDKQMVSLGIEKQRIELLTKETEDDLLRLIMNLFENPDLCKKYGKECSQFVRSDKNDLVFLEALNNAETSILK